MRTLLLLVLAPLFAISQPRHPDTVVSYHQGRGALGSPVLSVRSNPLKALGPPQNVDIDYGTVNFFSLGFGGNILLRMQPHAVTPNTRVAIFETTYGYQCGFYPEECTILMGKDTLSMTVVGSSCGNTNTLLAVPLSVDTVRYIRVVDTSSPSSFTAFSEEADGYDLDGIEIFEMSPLSLELGHMNASWEDGVLWVEATTLSETSTWRIQILSTPDFVYWETLFDFPGAGTTSFPQTYSGRIAFEPTSEITYLVVREIDLDGEYHLYDPVAVITRKNPTSPVFYDLLGRRVTSGNFLIEKRN